MPKSKLSKEELEKIKEEVIKEASPYSEGNLIIKAKKLREPAPPLEKLGVKVIETYPHAVRKLNKKAEEIFNKTPGTKHEKDARVCKVVASAYLKGKAKAFGKKEKIWYV